MKKFDCTSETAMKMNSLDELISKLNELRKDGYGFRGLKHGFYKLESSYTCNFELATWEKLKEYYKKSIEKHCQINTKYKCDYLIKLRTKYDINAGTIDKAFKNTGWGISDSNQISSIGQAKLLVETAIWIIQHNKKTPTHLMDTTDNPLVAAYFALFNCKPDDKMFENNQDELYAPHIVAIQNEERRIYKGNYEKYSTISSIKKILKDDLNMQSDVNRIIVQEADFFRDIADWDDEADFIRYRVKPEWYEDVHKILKKYKINGKNLLGNKEDIDNDKSWADYFNNPI